MLSDSEISGTRVTIHQPEFLPWLGFVDKIRQCDVFVLLDSVQFEKNYFQNRNKIRTGWGWVWLTVPVFMKGLFGQKIQEVRIRNDESWSRKHRQTLRQNYGSAPFFHEYFSGLEALYDQPWDLLAEFNIAVIHWVANAFGLSRQFIRSSELGVIGKRSELLVNICKTLGAKVYLSGVSGRDYLDEALFKDAGVLVRYQDFRHPVYRQRYEPFLHVMSSVDLLFNVGPSSLQALTEANTPNNRDETC